MAVSTLRRPDLRRVPRPTPAFWAVTALAAPVGASAADGLDDLLGLGPTGTPAVAAALLVLALGAQLTGRRCVPVVYWTTVVLASVLGGLLASALAGPGVPSAVPPAVLAVALVGLVGSVRPALSLSAVVPVRRELASWGAVLLAFAAGASAGGLLPRALGPARPLLVLLAAVAVVGAAQRRLRFGAVPATWSAYVLAGPLGTSLADVLATGQDDGGLGLGRPCTGFLLLAALVATATRLSRAERARPTPP